ncbi:MAG: SIS domain-containing protein, partial [Clostridia bacterium]
MIKDYIIDAIESERNAINIMLEGIDESHAEIVEIISKCKGKVVFMGVGKSGHIGEKLAATFASTGTPSFFVHSTEACHGDLGMIERRDIAILISNSGNTTKVAQDIPFLKKIGCTTIAFTSGKQSK